MVDYRKVEKTTWTPEQIASHLKAIGAEHPPKRPDKLQKSVTAPQQRNGNSKYHKRGGEW
ncbi:hypothetical protein PAECIP112173_02341 [Paenibacillus sp. JJ-100]|uniref:hypothetical protein n=1 Tax=Paenibacillus sp. JJ-100 TaxID=2974896 RepID=UPI0022FF94D7|nr:hypothetical protein [Paenibacillus sp. JJ-100]CAI6074732.1 hypothetical protein PAECIP112173_02341 [Paenibacillus sp. JJ-100]